MTDLQIIVSNEMHIIKHWFKVNKITSVNLSISKCIIFEETIIDKVISGPVIKDRLLKDKFLKYFVELVIYLVTLKQKHKHKGKNTNAYIAKMWFLFETYNNVYF